MKTTGLMLVLLCVMALQVSAQEAANSDTATAIRAVEHQWFEAQSRNDNGALDLIFDNALVYVEHGRLMTKGDYLSSVRSAKPQPQQVVMEAMTVRTFGSTAIVVGTYRETGVKDGRSLLRRWRFVDTWVNKKGRWMLVAAGAAPLSN
jgi:ketosteroid isomerase-like protein